MDTAETTSDFIGFSDTRRLAPDHVRTEIERGTKGLVLPPTIYVGFHEFGPYGVGNAGDFVSDPAEAADWITEHPGVRIYQIDHDFTTNLPESVRDVTEDLTRAFFRRAAE